MIARLPTSLRAREAAGAMRVNSIHGIDDPVWFSGAYRHGIHAYGRQTEQKAWNLAVSSKERFWK